jgi:hypothetical protein
MISEGGDLSQRVAGVARTNAIGNDGSSRRTPSRVRNEPSTPTETCAGVRTARVLPRVRSLAKAVTAEFTRRRANSRTANPSTAVEAKDVETDSEVMLRSDRKMSKSESSTIGVMAVLLVGLGRKSPAPNMEASFNSGKQRSCRGATI